MKIILNGKEKIINTNLKVSQLLENLNIDSNIIIVEINGEIIDRNDFDEACLEQEDVIELIRFMGGG